MMLQFISFWMFWVIVYHYEGLTLVTGRNLCAALGETPHTNHYEAIHCLSELEQHCQYRMCRDSCYDNMRGVICLEFGGRLLYTPAEN